MRRRQAAGRGVMRTLIARWLAVIAMLSLLGLVCGPRKMQAPAAPRNRHKGSAPWRRGR
jgi:hypothetical protein